jgi:hypothetical protein
MIRERLYLFDTTLRGRLRGGAVGLGFAFGKERRARTNQQSRRACIKDHAHG